MSLAGMNGDAMASVLHAFIITGSTTVTAANLAIVIGADPVIITA